MTVRDDQLPSRLLVVAAYGEVHVDIFLKLACLRSHLVHDQAIGQLMDVFFVLFLPMLFCFPFFLFLLLRQRPLLTLFDFSVLS